MSTGSVAPLTSQPWTVNPRGLTRPRPVAGADKEGGKGETEIRREEAVAVSKTSKLDAVPESPRPADPARLKPGREEAVAAVPDALVDDVALVGPPSRIASPFRWQRSSAARREMKSGRQRHSKLNRGLTVARQLKSVFTKTGRPWPSIARS